MPVSHYIVYVYVVFIHFIINIMYVFCLVLEWSWTDIGQFHIQGGEIIDKFLLVDSFINVRFDAYVLYRAYAYVVVNIGTSNWSPKITHGHQSIERRWIPINEFLRNFAFNLYRFEALRIAYELKWKLNYTYM